MDDQARIPAPNYTQIPNAIFDLMADATAGLTEKELKVLLAIARKTFGWHKKRDKISLSQLEEMTSMSRVSVVAGIKAAIKRGIVRQTPDKNDKRGGVFYELVIAETDQSTELTSTNSELVQNLNQSKIYTRTSTNSELELVQNLNPQKKGKEKKERGDDAPTKSPDELALAIADVCKINPKIATEKQRKALNATYQSLKAIGAAPADVKAREAWWYSNDWRAKKEHLPPRPDELLEIWEMVKGNGQAPKRAADLPLVTATGPTQTPEERKQAAERRRKIIEETRARNAS